MKITDLEIDGFGVWNNLKLTGLSRRVTAFYGPNEAGKTTVMQFMRSVLYGMSPERRKKYLPPLDGGRPGGTLGIVEGDLRSARPASPIAGPTTSVASFARPPMAPPAATASCAESLGDVDEPTFTNVFAVGLDEIHELGSLSGSKAAEWIYRLTSGLDRVSLFDVIQELRANRHALLNDEGQTSRIVSLTTNRDRLRAEVDRLREQNRLWSQLAVKIKELDDQIVAVESQVRKAEHHARTIEIAVGLKPNWRKREKLDEQLMHLSGRVTLPADAIERLNAINADIEKHQRQSDVLQGQRHQLRDEAERLGINELLVRNAQRIDALGEQRDWLQSLQRQQDELEREAKSYETRFAAEQKAARRSPRRQRRQPPYRTQRKRLRGPPTANRRPPPRPETARAGPTRRRPTHGERTLLPHANRNGHRRRRIAWPADGPPRGEQPGRPPPQATRRRAASRSSSAA